MEFGVIGISYKTAPLAIREICTFSDTKCVSFYDTLWSEGINQTVVISTCNRSEVYFLYDRKEQISNIRQMFYGDHHRSIEPYVFEQYGQAAITYLFEVCAGYHSQLLGEDQIFHQIKKAYDFANLCGTCKKEMHRIFQNCFKRTANMKKICFNNQNAISIASLAMQKLKAEESLIDKSVLIIGSGEMANLLRTYMAEEQLKHLYVCNRTLNHIKNDTHVSVVPFENRYEVVACCDIICSATSSPHIIIKKDASFMDQRNRYFIDFAVPRDIDPILHEESHITLWDMDDLKECVNARLEQRRRDMMMYHEEVLQDSKDTYDWLKHHRYDETLYSLQRRSIDMANHTYELLEHKLQLSSHEQHVLKKILHTSFLRMIKEPMAQLKQVKDEDMEAYRAMLETLFQGDDIL